MWIVMVSMVSGCLMYTVLVANATAMIATIDPAAKEYKSKVLMGESELHKIKLTLAKSRQCDLHKLTRRSFHLQESLQISPNGFNTIAVIGT